MKRLLIQKIACSLLLAFSLSANAQYSKITYIHSDADGTPFAATNQQGSIEWQIDHYPYGDEFSNTEVERKSDISFAGKPYDEEIGLSYFGGRWYDPSLGRFTSIDPVSVDPNDYRTFNRYAYGNNNPYKYVDPDGNFPFLIPIAIWAGKALAVSGAALSGYSVGSNGYGVYSGRKTADEAKRDAAIGVGSGLLLKGAGAGALRIGKNLDTTSLFRVVDDVELADIKKTGQFRTLPGQAEGKQFVDNAGDARALQGRFKGFFGGNQSVIEAKAPKPLVNGSDRTSFGDIPNGKAITITGKNLDKVKPKVN